MEFTKQFYNTPKIELHAHLSGSLSGEVVMKLLNQRNEAQDKITEAFSILQIGNKRSMKECFKIFDFIKLLTSDIETIRMITYEVIKEFNEDNVWYLELRTTPKLVEGAYNKEEYLEAVFQSISEAEKSMKILVRLLISIDREKGVEDGWDTLNWAKKYSKHELYGKYICGIDVSGNPYAGSLLEFIPILKEAKKCGLKLSVHLFEVNTDTAFEEAQEIIDQKLVDRIGHATFLHPKSGGRQTLTNTVKANKIPLEFCLSSNIKCGTVSCLQEHHLNIWKEENHPFVICTDDKGVFSTSLSEEIFLYSQAIGGNARDVQSMILNSVQSSFLQENEKRELDEKLKAHFNV